jgi:hypothetical protein
MLRLCVLHVAATATRCIQNHVAALKLQQAAHTAAIARVRLTATRPPRSERKPADSTTIASLPPSALHDAPSANAGLYRPTPGLIGQRRAVSANAGLYRPTPGCIGQRRALSANAGRYRPTPGVA